MLQETTQVMIANNIDTSSNNEDIIKTNDEPTLIITTE